jgi:AcrR family transcriptional regulator
MPVVKPPVQGRGYVTRGKILDAVAASLGEVGLAGTTTAAIAERAEISHGNVFRHFPTKADLLAATVEDQLARFVTAFRAGIAKASADPVHAACTTLWRIFRQPEMRGIFEIYVAARTDAALAKRLAPILERHRHEILRQARGLFPAAAKRNRDFDGAIDAIVYAMQGAALGLFSPEADDEVAHLAFLERLAHRELEGKK